MNDHIDRREFLKLAGIGGAVFASSLWGSPSIANIGWHRKQDFYFIQLSDTHWGFDGPKVNPDSRQTLKKAIRTINSMDQKPDFIVFTGDLTHTTDDPKVRRQRMDEFQTLVADLNAKTIRFMPGEHDASLDRGEIYQDMFGQMHYSFDHKGVHFITIDNVSDPTGSIGSQQLDWLKDDLAKQQPDSPIVVLTHRPLFDLYPQWDWATKDGARAIDLLMPYKNVTVFYGHIHQENHTMTEHIAHHSAKSLMFPLPAPGSVPKKQPILWNPQEPYKGLGFRQVDVKPKDKQFTLAELPVQRS